MMGNDGINDEHEENIKGKWWENACEDGKTIGEYGNMRKSRENCGKSMEDDGKLHGDDESRGKSMRKDDKESWRNHDEFPGEKMYYCRFQQR